MKSVHAFKKIIDELEWKEPVSQISAGDWKTVLSIYQEYYVQKMNYFYHNYGVPVYKSNENLAWCYCFLLYLLL